MNANKEWRDECCVPAPAPAGETLPIISAKATEMLEDTEAILERVLAIIEAKNEGRPNTGKEINCFRDSLSDLRIRAERVNSLARRLLETFQS